MRLVRRVVMTAVAAVQVAQPAAAFGDTLTRADAVGDVWRSPIGSSTYLPAPTRVEGDITSTRVTHGRRAVWVAIRLRDLTMTSNGNFNRIAITSDRRFRSVEIDAFPGHWAGHAVTTTATGRVVGCGVTLRIDYDRNVVILRMPRVCLGRPHWVRVATRTTVAGSAYAYVDDGRATGFTTGLVYGPRVRR